MYTVLGILVPVIFLCGTFEGPSAGLVAPHMRMQVWYHTRIIGPALLHYCWAAVVHIFSTNVKNCHVWNYSARSDCYLAFNSKRTNLM